MDIEEVFTEGDDGAQASFNAAEVLTGVLAVRLERGEDIPIPSPADGRPVADADVQAAVLVDLTRQGRLLSELTRTIKQLARDAAALGKRLVISLE